KRRGIDRLHVHFFRGAQKIRQRELIVDLVIRVRIQRHIDLPLRPLQPFQQKRVCFPHFPLLLSIPVCPGISHVSFFSARQFPTCPDGLKPFCHLCNHYTPVPRKRHSLFSLRCPCGGI